MSKYELEIFNADQKSFKADDNLVGFFELLLKVDKRVNPHLYEDNRELSNAKE